MPEEKRIRKISLTLISAFLLLFGSSSEANSPENGFTPPPRLTRCVEPPPRLLPDQEAPSRWLPIPQPFPSHPKLKRFIAWVADPATSTIRLPGEASTRRLRLSYERSGHRSQKKRGKNEDEDDGWSGGENSFSSTHGRGNRGGEDGPGGQNQKGTSSDGQSGKHPGGGPGEGLLGKLMGGIFKNGTGISGFSNGGGIPGSGMSEMGRTGLGATRSGDPGRETPGQGGGVDGRFSGNEMDPNSPDSESPEEGAANTARSRLSKVLSVVQRLSRPRLDLRISQDVRFHAGLKGGGPGMGLQYKATPSTRFNVDLQARARDGSLSVGVDHRF